jgi:hypothetical protein
LSVVLELISREAVATGETGSSGRILGSDISKPFTEWPKDFPTVGAMAQQKEGHSPTDALESEVAE